MRKIYIELSHENRAYLEKIAFKLIEYYPDINISFAFNPKTKDQPIEYTVMTVSIEHDDSSVFDKIQTAFELATK